MRYEANREILHGVHDVQGHVLSVEPVAGPLIATKPRSNGAESGTQADSRAESRSISDSTERARLMAT